MIDKMNRLEKIALTSAVSGAVFNVFLYGIGATLETAKDGNLFIARVIAAILQAAAFDLVAIATVMGMRTGRRGAWSMATAGASALVSAAIALDVAGVLAMPWLHAANALIVLAFTLHLLTPRKTTRAAQLRRLVRRLCTEVRQERTRTDQIAVRMRQALERVSQLEAQPRQQTTIEIINVSGRELSLRQLADVTGIPLTTLRRRVAQLPAPVAQEVE